MPDNIDTIAFMDTLTEGGFPEKQAKALAKAMYQLIESQLVTKSYLDMKLSEIRVEMAQMKAELIQWMVTLFLVQIGVMAGLLKLLH